MLFGFTKGLKIPEFHNQDISNRREMKKTSECDIDCPAGSQFSSELGDCVPNCGENYEFSTKYLKCVSICPEGEIFGENVDKCRVKCEEGGHYDKDLDACVQKCDKECVLSIKINTPKNQISWSQYFGTLSDQKKWNHVLEFSQNFIFSEFF